MRRLLALLMTAAAAAAAAAEEHTVALADRPIVATAISSQGEVAEAARQLQGQVSAAPIPAAAAAASVYPTLTLSMRIGLAEQARTGSNNSDEPTEDEMRAFFCQVQRFLQQRLRDKTGDTAIVTLLQNLNYWNVAENNSTKDSHNATTTTNDNDATLHMNFTTHSTFVDSSVMSPWTLVKHVELPREDIQGLIRNYIWPLNNTIFVRTRTLYFGGRLAATPPTSAVAAPSAIWEPLNMTACPPAPPFPKGNNIFGHQTPVPVVEDTTTAPPESNGNNNEYDGRFQVATNNVMGTQQEQQQIRNTPPDEHSAGTTSTTRDEDSSLALAAGRNRLTLVVPFWIANDGGITNLELLQNQWLQPSWSELVAYVVKDYHNNNNNHHHHQQLHLDNGTSSSNLPEVVPNSATVVQVVAMACPIPTTDIPSSHKRQEVVWFCHQVTAVYDISLDSVSIPMTIQPAVYTYEIKLAIQTGIFQEILVNNAATTYATDGNNYSSDGISGASIIRIGNYYDALQPSWWQSDRHSSPSLSSSGAQSIWLGIAVSGVTLVLVIIFFLVPLTWYYQHKVRVLRGRRKVTLWEMEALLLWPSSCSNSGGDIDINGSGKNGKQQQRQRNNVV